MDKASIEFSKFFYDEVFDQYSNVCEAFWNAKKKVEDTFGKYQADKMKLFTNEKTHGEKCPEQKDRRLNLNKQKTGTGVCRQINIERGRI